VRARDRAVWDTLPRGIPGRTRRPCAPALVRSTR
jgi:hypothetical protein